MQRFSPLYQEDLHCFLEQFRSTWEKEVLECDLAPTPKGPSEKTQEELISELCELELAERLSIENAGLESSFRTRSQGLQKVRQRAVELSSLPPIPENKNAQKHDYLSSKKQRQGVRAKKQKEVAVPLDYIDQIISQKQLNSHILVEWGGGVGHAGHLYLHDASHKHLRKVLSIDQNIELQLKGIDKLKKADSICPSDVTYLNAHIPSNIESVSEHLATEHSTDIFHLGLHCCGEFSRNILELACSRREALFLAPCCHHLLQTDNWFMSKTFEGLNFQLDRHASLLASYWKPLTLKEAKKRTRVKTFRYGLQLFQVEFFGQQHFEAVGNGSNADYAGSFSDYVKKYSPAMPAMVSKSRLPEALEIERFFRSSSVQKQIHQMIVGSEFRNWFARPLERLLFNDLECYADEQNCNGKSYECFRVDESPRNFALILEGEDGK